MELTVGEILEGKVKSITNFGAFIALPEGKTGMVHISDIANTYVHDIHDFLTENQEVRAVVISLDGNKIGLSIKKLEAKPRTGAARKPAAARPAAPPAPKTVDQLFEEKLKRFMSESDSKISSLRSEHRTRSRRR